MRFGNSFLSKKLKLGGVIVAICLLTTLIALGCFRIFAEPLGDDARVYENDTLTYYITVNSDGIDYASIESSDSQTSEETSGITTVSDTLPEGLIFQGFVTSLDGTFGAVQRDDKTTQCSGRVIDDTNEESTAEGSWNADNTEYTYHGLHYNASTRKVTFRTKAIGAGCELTVGVITKTPYLGEYEYRKDFYDHASFVDESLFGDSNTVHAWMQKNRPVDPEPETIPETIISEDTPKPDDNSYSISYKLSGDIPDEAPSLPVKEWHHPGDSITFADPISLDCYDFDGWWADISATYSFTGADKVPLSSFNSMPNFNIIVWGTLTKTCADDPIEPDDPEPQDETPEKYDVTYEVEGTKPSSFNIPARRSYYSGASVSVDSTSSEGDNIDGYDFSGWNTDDVALGDDASFTMPKKNVLLRGSFEQQSYTVSYEFIGDVVPGNASSLLPASAEYHAGDSVTVANVPSAEGYVFSGWYADPSFEMPAEDVVIKGEWTKNREEFTPDIVVEITNPQSEYYKGDIVNFKITVSNDKDFALNNVWLEELLEGAIFVPGDGYAIESDNFISIATVPANGSAVVYAKFDVTKNIEKIYTNSVKFVAADIDSQDYVFPAEWDNTASVDFATGILTDIPVDVEPEEPEQKSPITYDGVGKMVLSGASLAGGLGLCIFLSRKNRRGGIVYAYCAGIMVVSGLAVVIINGGANMFADSLTLRPSLDIKSEHANYDNGDAGAWNVNGSAKWTGVGEALYTVKVNTKSIANLHNKDVVLIIDNGVWTTKAIDGTPVDRDSERTTLEWMQLGASEFVEDLLSDGDSSVVIVPTWGNYNNEMTSSANEAVNQVMAVTSTDDVSYSNYAESYSKVTQWLDNNYTVSDDRKLNIVYIADDHIAHSNDIAKYEILKQKYPKASISSIGYGVKELINERYTSSASANENGIVRFWVGTDGNLNPIGSYSHAVDGLDQISGLHVTPVASQLASSLSYCVGTSTMYEKFNITTTLNLEDFDIKGIYGNDGDIDIQENVITWTNEDNQSFVSGGEYEMSVLLRAKDETVEKHKLYRVNTNTTIESDARDVEAEDVSSSESVVIMNGYEVTFDVNNSGTCNLGNNQTKVYLAFQKISLDESGVSCEGWNFDMFRDSADGTVYSSINNKMPAADLALKATWRKVDVEVHMDGTVYVIAPAVLKKGLEVDEQLRDIRQNAVGYSGGTALLKWDEGCPDEYIDNAHRISDDNSPTAIYAWIQTGNAEYDNYEPGADTISYYNPLYYCTEADMIKLNEDSSRLFFYGAYTDEESHYHDVINYIEMIEGIEDWDASDVKSLDYAFYGNSSLSTRAFARMKDWDTSNVESMNYTFYGTRLDRGEPQEEALSGWDTSNVKSMKYTFGGDDEVLKKLKGIKNWDVSNVEDMEGIFFGSGAPLESVADWNVKSVKNLDNAFMYSTTDFSPLANWGQKFTQLESTRETFARIGSSSNSVDLSSLSSWNMGNVKNMSGMFHNSSIADLRAFSSWDVSNVEDMSEIFAYAGVNTANDNSCKLDGIGSWNVGSVKNLREAFEYAGLKDLSALSGWNVSNVEDMRSIFANNTSLTSLDGLADWEVSKVTTLREAFLNDNSLTDLSALSGWTTTSLGSLYASFAGISADDASALSGWDVSNVTDMSYTFCGKYKSMNGYDCLHEEGKGIKSLAGIEGWNTSNVELMAHFVGGNALADLSPISGWNVSSVKDLSGAFSHMPNLVSLEPLSGWITTSLSGIGETFSHDEKIKNLHGLEGWNVSNVSNMDETFAYMDSLENVSALSRWNTASLESMSGTFRDHKKLTSLDGLQNWNVSNVDALNYTFMGYSPYTFNQYTNWSEFCDSSLTDISALNGWGGEGFDPYRLIGTLACNDKLQDLAPLSSWSSLSGRYGLDMSRMFEGDKSVTSLNGLQNLIGSNHKNSPKFNWTFAYMTNLRDISALASWQSDNTSSYGEAESMFRNDSSITDLSPLENTVLKKVPSYQRYNMFDGVPDSVARPTWY